MNLLLFLLNNHISINMEFAVLASGSKANCTYLKVGDLSLLLDCGLSAKQTVMRLEALDVDPAQINAILVSHEHSDHIKGISVFSRRFKIPVYGNPATAGYFDNVHSTQCFETGRAFTLLGVKITPFSIVHDAADPVGFRIEGEGSSFAQATDIGRSTTLLESNLKGCNAIVLEANHDPAMLQECHYPWELKQRISSSHGHLSNQASALLLRNVLSPALRHVVLAHLSENSNSAELALSSFASISADYPALNIICGAVDHSTELYRLSEAFPADSSLSCVNG